MSNQFYACVRLENTWKTCLECVKITSFANIVYERHQQVSRVIKLMPVKVLAQSSRQVPDSSEYQPAGCLLNIKTNSWKMSKMSTRRSFTKSVTWHSSKHYLKSLSTFKRQNCLHSLLLGVAQLLGLDYMCAYVRSVCLCVCVCARVRQRDRDPVSRSHWLRTKRKVVFLSFKCDL